MIANLCDIYGKTFIGRHKLTFHLEKLYKFINIHIFCRTSIEALIFSELFTDCLLNDNSE